MLSTTFVESIPGLAEGCLRVAFLLGNRLLDAVKRYTRVRIGIVSPALGNAKKVGRFSSVNKIDDHMGPKGNHPTVTLFPRTPSALLNTR